MSARKVKLTTAGKVDRRCGPRQDDTRWQDNPRPFTLHDEAVNLAHVEDLEAAGMTCEKRLGFHGRPEAWLIYLKTGEGAQRDRCCIYRGLDRFVVEDQMAGEIAFGGMGLPNVHATVDGAWNAIRRLAFMRAASYSADASFDLATVAASLPAWLTTEAEG